MELQKRLWTTKKLTACVKPPWSICTHVEYASSYHHSGKVGIVLNGEWSEPLDPTDDSNIEASERNLQFTVGWFAHPIFKNGTYPPVMRERVGKGA